MLLSSFRNYFCLANVDPVENRCSSTSYNCWMVAVSISLLFARAVVCGFVKSLQMRTWSKIHVSLGIIIVSNILLLVVKIFAKLSNSAWAKNFSKKVLVFSLFFSLIEGLCLLVLGCSNAMLLSLLSFFFLLVFCEVLSLKIVVFSVVSFLGLSEAYKRASQFLKSNVGNVESGKDSVSDDEDDGNADIVSEVRSVVVSGASSLVLASAASYASERSGFRGWCVRTLLPMLRFVGESDNEDMEDNGGLKCTTVLFDKNFHKIVKRLFFAFIYVKIRYLLKLLLAVIGRFFNRFVVC